MPLHVSAESYHPINKPGFAIVADSNAESLDLSGGHDRGIYSGATKFDKDKNALFFNSKKTRDFALRAIEAQESILG